MTKYFQRGKYSNNYRLVNFRAVTEQPRYNAASNTSFTKNIIIRGIGYRAFIIINDFSLNYLLNSAFILHKRELYFSRLASLASEATQTTKFDFPNTRYLMVRAGHTRDLYLPLSGNTFVKTSKKDRKLTIASSNNVVAANMAKQLWLYRRPSVYTGRGVRLKHIRSVRKAGKKDKQKGKAF